MKCTLLGLLLCLPATFGTLGCSHPSPSVVIPPPGFATDPDVVALIDRLVGAAKRVPDSSASHRTLGLALAANGSWDLAETCFQNALELDPKDLEARYQWAMAAGERGDLGLRIERLQELITKQPAFFPAINQLGIELLEKGDFDGAKAQFEALRTGYTKSPFGALGLGEWNLARNQFEEAARWLEKVRALWPTDLYVEFLLGQAYLGQGREEEAASLLALGGSHGRPRLNASSSVEMRKYQVGRSDMLAKAIALLKASDYAGSIPILEGLRSKDPKDTTCLSNLAVAYLYSGQPEKALAVLDEAIPLQPDQFELYLNRTACLLELQERKRRSQDSKGAAELLAKAQEAVDMGLRLQPNSLQGNTLLGRVRLAQDRPGEALTSFLKVIDQGGTDESNYVLLARTVMLVQGPAEALRWVEEGLTKPGARMELRFHQCGLLAQSLQGPLAREKQRAMAALDAQNPWTLRADEVLRKAGF